MADPNCASSSAGSFEREGPPNIAPLACGSVELTDFTGSGAVPAYVHTPSDEGEKFIRYQDATGHKWDDGYDSAYDPAGEEFMAIESPYETRFVNAAYPQASMENERLYSKWSLTVDHNSYSGQGTDTDRTTSQYGFASALPAGTGVDLKFEFSSLYTDSTDGGEWGELAINATFYDVSGNIVAEDTKTVGGGLDERNFEATYEYGYAPNRTSYRHFVFAKYPELHFNDVGGATSMRVTLTATSHDDLDDQGWPDESDDYTGSDPSVWGGLVGMDIACPDNLAPVAVNDGGVNRADRLPIENSGVTYVQVLSNDYDPDNRDSLTYNDDVLIIDKIETRPSYGLAVVDGSQIIYSPDWSKTFTQDSFSYTISDGDLTDSATVFLRTVEETGHITVQMVDANKQLVVDVGGTASLDIAGRSQPINDWPLEDGQLEFTVALGTSTVATPKLVELKGYQLPSGYKIDQSVAYPVDKNTELGENWTQDKRSALLGIDFALNETPTPTANQPPTAFANAILDPDRSTNIRQYFNADGSGSSDPDGDSLSYSWSVADIEVVDENGNPQNAGSGRCHIESSGGAQAEGYVDSTVDDWTTTCTFRLTVTDPAGQSDNYDFSVRHACQMDGGLNGTQFCADVYNPDGGTGGGGGTTEPPSCESYTNLSPYPNCPDGSTGMVDADNCTRYCSGDGGPQQFDPTVN